MVFVQLEKYIEGIVNEKNLLEETNEVGAEVCKVGSISKHTDCILFDRC